MPAEAQTENAANSDERPDSGATAPENSGAAGAGGETARRERSSIEFPYTNLEDAERTVQAIVHRAGTSALTYAQVADAIGASAESSTFRVRMSGMQTFGLIEQDQGRYRVTPLGRDLANAATAPEARVRAFLRVPLYKQISDRHDGRTLPRPQALEQEFKELGVASKQTERARQAFDRSARHAGFTKAGSDRFVVPFVSAQEERREQDAALPKPPPVSAFGNGSGGGEGGADHPETDPVISALVRKIPATGTQWSEDEQVQLLQMLAMAFRMTFKNKRTITVKIESETSQ